MADNVLIDRAVVQQALSWILYTRRFLGIDEPKEERALRTALAEQAEPVQFDPAEAMRLADDYASAQSEMDIEHSVNRRPYYVESRNDARAKLAAYLGIKGGGNG